jgi:hypothetical protein
MYVCMYVRMYECMYVYGKLSTNLAQFYNILEEHTWSILPFVS